MKYCYICDDCLNEASGGDYRKIPAQEYNKLCEHLAVSVEHKSTEQAEIMCDICGGPNMRRLLTPPSSYVRGYGYLDKQGATNDRDLWLMTQDKDPYKDSRKPGEKEAVIQKLRKNKEFNPKTQVIRISKK